MQKGSVKNQNFFSKKILSDFFWQIELEFVVADQKILVWEDITNV